jgi:hypothetical protein
LYHGAANAQTTITHDVILNHIHGIYNIAKVIKVTSTENHNINGNKTLTHKKR